MLSDVLAALDTPYRYVILDADPGRWGQRLYDIDIAGGEDLLPVLKQGGATHFVVAVGSAGCNANRCRLYGVGLAAGLAPLTIEHPSAIRSPRASVGSGSQLMPGCILNAGARLGVNVIVNSGAIVEHDCEIGDHTHIAPGAVLSGSVVVGASAHIGTGAAVRQGIRIGAGAVVGVGAAVVRDVPDGVIVVGNPARPLPR